MNVCLECFMHGPPAEGWDFMNPKTILYVKLTEQNFTCDVCKQEKPIIVQSVRRLMDPFKGHPPADWVDIRQINMPLNEEEVHGSTNPSEGS